MLRELLARLKEARRDGRDAVLCSLVETRGSTPQKPGACMLVFPDGRQTGTLGGGCTEAEVRREALKMFDAPEPRVFSYTLDDDYGWDDGLICGGRMTFVVQPIPAGRPSTYFEALEDVVESGRGAAEAVVFDPDKAQEPVGARRLYDAAGRLLAAHLCDGDRAVVAAHLKDVGSRPKPYCRDGVAYIPIHPRRRLLIVGAGHVGQAVADLAAKVDFDVWVLDDRETFANRERFPDAQRIWVSPIAAALQSYQPDGDAYCLVMTRGHSNDQEALFHLAGKPAGYLGLIGSRRKIRLILESLEQAGVPREALEKVYAPLGFDIGSQTVPEIAVSIVAHLVGHRNRGPEAFPPNGGEYLSTK